MVALLERLHAKHNAARPWQETSKVVRQAMVRHTHYIIISILHLHVYDLVLFSL